MFQVIHLLASLSNFVSLSPAIKNMMLADCLEYLQLECRFLVHNFTTDFFFF